MPQQKPIAMANKQKQQQQQQKQQQQQQKQQHHHQQQLQQQKQHQHHQQQNAKMIQDLANLKLNLLESNQKNANNTLNNNSNANVNVNHIQFPESDETKLARQLLHMKQHSLDFDLNANADITDFVTSNKTDSKLQHTLSYNAMRSTKSGNMGGTNQTTAIPNATTTTTAGKMIAMSKESFDEVESTANFNFNECDSAKDDYDVDTKAPKSCLQMPSAQNEMLSAINKSVASTATSAAAAAIATNTTCASSNGNQRLDTRTLQKSKLSMTHQIPSGNLVVPPRKPISSVAPTSITSSVKSTIPSPRVHAVAPNMNSIPISSTLEQMDQSRPALPPKPNKNNDSNSSNESSPSSNGSSTSSNASAHRSTSLITSPMVNAPSEKLVNNDKHATMDIGQQINSHIQAIDFPIKAKPLTIKKQPLSEQPRLRSLASGIKPIQYTSRRIEMPPTLLYPENDRIKSNVEDNKMPMLSKMEKKQTSTAGSSSSNSSLDENDKSPVSSVSSDSEKTAVSQINDVVRRQRSSMSDNTKVKLTRRVSFDPLALLLDASLEGELELVQKTASQVLFFNFMKLHISGRFYFSNC